jgi:sugar lactone lactonase YvrE
MVSRIRYVCMVIGLWLLIGCTAPAPADIPATVLPMIVAAPTPVVAAQVIAAPTILAVAQNTPEPTASGRDTPAATVFHAPATPTPGSAALRDTPGRTVALVAGNLRDPDDLALGPDGRIYVSDVRAGSVLRIEPDGSTTVVVTGLREPEGMVFLPGGDLIIAEQGTNRLVRYDPVSRTTAPFLALPNTTGKMGVDGIALDDHIPGQPSLIVPDSPEGTVLRVSLDGKQVQTIGRGLVRPVAAWVEPDGNILIADEFGNRLARLRADGSLSTLARLPEPDDVIEDAAGHIYVNTLSDGAIHEVDATTGASRIVERGLIMPQGLAFSAGGALLASDPGRGRVVRVALP